MFWDDFVCFLETLLLIIYNTCRAFVSGSDKIMKEQRYINYVDKLKLNTSQVPIPIDTISLTKMPTQRLLCIHV